LASSWSSSPDYAGFWQRAIAFLVDWLIVAVIYVPIAVALFGRRHFSLDPTARVWDLLGTLAVAFAVIWFWRRFGATPGKLAVAVKIVDAQTGGVPSTGRLVIRLLSYIVSALPFYLGFLWIAIDRRKQGWHDKIAGTVVINDD
jgi:uncharacterized RDD family membrane protein YckC